MADVRVSLDFCTCQAFEAISDQDTAAGDTDSEVRADEISASVAAFAAEFGALQDAVVAECACPDMQWDIPDSRAHAQAIRDIMLCHLLELWAVHTFGARNVYANLAACFGVEAPLGCERKPAPSEAETAGASVRS